MYISSAVISVAYAEYLRSGATDADIRDAYLEILETKSFNLAKRKDSIEAAKAILCMVEHIREDGLDASVE
jgi:hypothetical protein